MTEVNELGIDKFVELTKELLPFIENDIIPTIKEKVAVLPDQNPMLLMTTALTTITMKLNEKKSVFDKYQTTPQQFMAFAQMNRVELEEYAVSHPEIEDDINRLKLLISEISPF